MTERVVRIIGPGRAGGAFALALGAGRSDVQRGAVLEDRAVPGGLDHQQPLGHIENGRHPAGMDGYSDSHAWE